MVVPVTMTSKNIMVGDVNLYYVIAGLVCGTSYGRSLVAHAATFLLSRLGLFQLGFLHLGHTFGSVTDVVRLGTHSWSHLLQMQTKVCPIGIGTSCFGYGRVDVTT